jgi:hypothetical protein
MWIMNQAYVSCIFSAHLSREYVDTLYPVLSMVFFRLPYMPPRVTYIDGCFCTRAGHQ